VRYLNLTKFTVDLGKTENPGTNIDFAVFKIVWWIPWPIFFEPSFPHNFAKNDRHDLNLGCINASRRQLQLALKIGV
jgi:hypothetical protein